MSVVKKKIPIDINRNNIYFRNLFIEANVQKRASFLEHKIDCQDQKYQTDQVVHPDRYGLEHDQRKQNKYS